MKKKILSLVIFITIGTLGFVVYSKFFGYKVDFRSPNKIAESLQIMSNTSKLEGYSKVFDLSNEKCSIIATISGKQVLESFKIRLFFKSSPINSLPSKKEDEQKTECIEKTLRALINIFESKKTKQEFIKFSKKIFIDFKGQNHLERRFFNSKVLVENDKGELLISLTKI
jgi:hypothetical protein